MSELREEKRHRIREGDRTGEDLAASINKVTQKIEMKLWMKWSVTIVCVLLTIIGWLSADFIAKLKADAADGPKALALIEPRVREFEELKKEQRRMAHNMDRMTIFFETKWGMPREVRSRQSLTSESEDN